MGTTYNMASVPWQSPHRHCLWLLHLSAEVSICPIVSWCCHLLLLAVWHDFTYFWHHYYCLWILPSRCQWSSPHLLLWLWQETNWREALSKDSTSQKQNHYCTSQASVLDWTCWAHMANHYLHGHGLHHKKKQVSHDFWYFEVKRAALLNQVPGHLDCQHTSPFELIHMPSLTLKHSIYSFLLATLITLKMTMTPNPKFRHKH